MDSKSSAAMSGALETPTVNITAAAAWMPTLNTPSLKLPTPVLDGMGNNDWGSIPAQSAGGAAAGTGAGGLLSAGGPGGLGSGMSPRFMLESLRMSPGVSGSIAPNADAPKASRSSLAELFIVNEYSSSATPANTSASHCNAVKPVPTLPASSSAPSISQPVPVPVQASVSVPQTSAAALPPKQPLPTRLAPQQQSEAQLGTGSGAPGAGPTRPLQHHLPQRGIAASQAMGLGVLSSQILQDTAGVKREVAPQTSQVGYSQARPVPLPSGLSTVPRAGVLPQSYSDVGYGSQGLPSTGALGIDNPVPHSVSAPRRNALPNAIEEAKANAQERADKFAAKRKRTRQQFSEVEKPKEPEVSEEDKHLSPSELKKKRYNRRLELNRQSAAVSRVRRRAYVEELEGKLMHVEREKLSLEDQVAVMQSENHKLREQMRHLHDQLAAGRPFLKQ